MTPLDRAESPHPAATLGFDHQQSRALEHEKRIMMRQEPEKKIPRFGRYLVGAVALSAVLLAPLPGNARGPDVLMDRMTRAVDLAGKGDCAGAWEALWSLARTGDRDAVAATGLMIYAGLIEMPLPPLSASERRSKLARRLVRVDRLTVAFVIYSTQSRRFAEQGGNWRQTNTIIYGIKKYFGKGPSVGKILECYKESSRPDDCAKLAVSLGLIPDFQGFVNQFDAFSRDGRKATCGTPRY
jgi:hypothetical protein